MVKSLVTGIAGFLGSHVADELLKMGHEVVGIDDLSAGFKENIPSDAKFYDHSIFNASMVQFLFEKERPDFVFHLAAYAAEGLSHHIKRFNYENNLLGSVNLINASINYGVKRFVFTSSIAVYGVPTHLPVRESDPCNPVDPYGIAKLAVEQELQASHSYFGLDYTIFRPHNVYGERQNIGDRYRNVVGIFMNQCLKGEPMEIFGDGRQTRAFSYVGDVVPVIAQSITTGHAQNEIFNLGSDSAYSVRELMVLVADSLKVDPFYKMLPARDEVRDIYASHGKVGRTLGAVASTRLPDGLERMAQWVKAHGARESSQFGNIEIVRNLPEAWK